MATPYVRFIRRASSFPTYSSSLEWEGGVSMVQGASRGIGLEFVRQPFFHFGFLAVAAIIHPNSIPQAATALVVKGEMIRIQGTAWIEDDQKKKDGDSKARYDKLFFRYNPDPKKTLDLLKFINVTQVKQLLEKNDKGQVVATCRNPTGATGLLELKKRFSERLDIQTLDLAVESTIEDSARSIAERYGSLNLLINASGVLSIPDVLQPETTLNKVQRSSLLRAYDINAVGPILVIKHMWPLLKVGGGSGTEREVAVIANLSARVGSIGDNRLGGWHSYRSSKTALNQCMVSSEVLTKTVSVELARKKDPIICLLMHPGTVDTDLSRPFQRNVAEGKLFTREFSVQKLLSIINNAKSHDNGKFLAWDGQEIPW
ncbi:hypothetical protein RJ640_016330 [Escallonia rubra]|uniref:Short-chain dehydrogenase/reductase n=1 Tax=Escallonia rubra TaxID=112253 RepID=A0AA88R542_9ASTE|nr:hypothetical protein RJ640_016330 [Escallonia rubra]